MQVQLSVGTENLAPCDQPPCTKNLTAMQKHSCVRPKAVDCVPGGVGQTRSGGCGLSPQVRQSVFTVFGKHREAASGCMQSAPAARYLAAKQRQTVSHQKLLTVSQVVWDRPDLGVTCPHRCDRVMVPCEQPPCTRNLAEMPNTTLSEQRLLTASQEALDRPGMGVTCPHM